MTVCLLYPAAMVKLIIAQPEHVIAVAAMYAYDQVLYTGDDFARAELHDATCNYYRILTDKVLDKRLAASLA